MYYTSPTFSSKYTLFEELIVNCSLAPSSSEIVLKLKFHRLVYIYFIICLPQFVV